MRPPRRSRRSLAAAIAVVPLVAGTLPALAAPGDASPPPDSSDQSTDAAAAEADAAKAQTPTVKVAQGTRHAKQPELSARDKQVIAEGPLQFKDLNASGELDPYEDWRLGAAERAKDLVGRMTLDEKAGLMMIDTLNAACGGAVPTTFAGDPRLGIEPNDNIAEDYLNRQQMRLFIVRNGITANPDCEAATASVSPYQMALYTNGMQESAEAGRLGIPVMFKSNARNHLDPNPRPGVNNLDDGVTTFPKEAGLAAAALGEQHVKSGRATDGDMGVVADFAEIMGNEWAAMGINGMYGYMADLSTEPRWYRTHETFTENAGLASNIMTTLIRGVQGRDKENGVALSPDSKVMLTLKHFPGGGPQELGLDPHYAFGKTQVYPGGQFAEHLKPFEAAIKAGVASIMPYYGVPMDVTYNGRELPQVGYAFSKDVVDWLLRDQLGFKGNVNSDTGIINDRAWGLEEATVPERIAAAVNGGTDTLSGFHDLETITSLVEDGLVTEERVDLAAERLITPMFQMGLFENPYVEPGRASDLVGAPASRETALDVQRKSLVLLDNKQVAPNTKALPLAKGEKLYMIGQYDKDVVESYGYEVIDGNATPRPSAAGADRVIVTMSGRNVNAEDYKSDDPATGLNPQHINPIEFPGVKGLDGESPYGAADQCNAYGAKTCTDDGLVFGGSFPWESNILDFTGMSEAQSWEVVPKLDVVQAAMKEVGDPNKVILSIYFRQPYVIDAESGLREAGATIANFGATDEALMDVLSGEVAPQGRLPFALPATRAAVEQQLSDLPGYAETDDGALYEYGFGLTYDRKR